MITIIFTGIVYLMSTHSANKLEAILPRITESSGAYRSMVEPHVAYVTFAKSDIANSIVAFNARPPDFTFLPGGAGSERVVYVLRGDELMLSASSALTPAFEVCRADGGNCTINEGAKRFSYGKVAHRDKICKDCTLDPSYQKQSREIVAAHMVTTVGTLYAREVDKTIDWTFEPGKNKFKGEAIDHKGGLAESVALDVKTTATTVFLKLKPFAGNNAAEVTLEFKTGSEIEIGNMPLADVLHLQTEFGEAETEDPHFALYYLMMNGPIPADPPIPHRAPKDRGTAAGHGGNCPPLADEN